MTATALRQWHLTILGAPRTKKNSLQLVINHRKNGTHKQHILPSKAWKEWCAAAYIQPSGVWFPDVRAEDTQLNCRAHFYRDARRGDACGYYQGLADLLEKRGIIANDSQLVSWDGSRLFVCKENPRVEVTLEEIR